MYPGFARLDARTAIFAKAVAWVLAPVPPSAIAKSVARLLIVLFVSVCVSDVPTISPVGAAFAVMVPEPLETGMPEVVPANRPSHEATKVLRTNAMRLRIALSTLPGDMPVLTLMPSRVVLLAAVADQSNKSAIFAS